jgi:hypothetical protein
MSFLYLVNHNEGIPDCTVVNVAVTSERRRALAAELELFRGFHDGQGKCHNCLTAIPASLHKR